MLYDVTLGKADAGQMVPVAVCHLPQQTAGGSARFKIRLLNTHHPLQSQVVWIDCPAIYADTRFTAQMTSLFTISTTDVTVCSEFLGMQHVCKAVSALLRSLFTI